MSRSNCTRILMKCPITSSMRSTTPNKSSTRRWIDIQTWTMGRDTSMVASLSTIRRRWHSGRFKMKMSNWIARAKVRTRHHERYGLPMTIRRKWLKIHNTWAESHRARITITGRAHPNKFPAIISTHTKWRSNKTSTLRTPGRKRMLQ